MAQSRRSNQNGGHILRTSLITHSAETVAGELCGLAKLSRWGMFTSALPQMFEIAEIAVCEYPRGSNVCCVDSEYSVSWWLSPGSIVWACDKPAKSWMLSSHFTLPPVPATMQPLVVPLGRNLYPGLDWPN